ncbi:MAG: spore coat protein CotJB [Clostridia bacterium]|nr:spore coat protein CotJB [Clostridia bacterium]
MNHHQPIDRDTCRREKMQLRALDFAIQETVLFLDAYPEHPQALAYYHRLCEERRELLAKHEKHCGPVSMYGNANQNAWDWVKGPWPWEPDAN